MALTDCRTILNFETTAKMSPSDGYAYTAFSNHMGMRRPSGGMGRD